MEQAIVEFSLLSVALLGHPRISDSSLLVLDVHSLPLMIDSSRSNWMHCFPPPGSGLVAHILLFVYRIFVTFMNYIPAAVSVFCLQCPPYRSYRSLCVR